MNKTEKRALGALTKHLRKKSNLTQADFSKILLVSQSEISCIENGKSDKDIRIYIDYINQTFNYQINADVM